MLCRRLQDRGIRVRATARRCEEGPWEDFIVAELGETDLPVEMLDGIDTVFHLAGKAHSLSEVAEDDAEYRRVNVGGMDALLSVAAKTALSRLVFLSSVKAMADDGDACRDEDWDAAPKTAYGRSKLEAERLLFAAGRNSGMHVTALRLPLVYGRGVKGNLCKMMDAIERGRFPPLPAMKNKRSLVHVDDVVRAAVLATENPRANGQVYIVTDGHAYSTDEIVRTMRDALGKPAGGSTVPLAVLRMAAGAGDLIGRLRRRRFVFDSDAYRKLLGSAWYSSRKIERELGFRATRDLRDGVEEMVKGFRATGGAGLGAAPT